MLIISTLLGYKVGFAEFIFRGLNANNTAKIEEKKRTSNDLLIRLYETYKSSCESLIVSRSRTQISEEQNIGTNMGLVDTLEDESPFGRYNKVTKNKYSLDVSNEIERYLADVVEDPFNSSFNILLR